MLHPCTYAQSPLCSFYALFIFLTDVLAPLVLSTWIKGSLGRIKSLKEIKPIRLTIGDEVTALTESPITIDCPVTGRPKPTVTWKRNGKDIADGEDYKLLGGVNNSIAVLKTDSVADSGIFVCTATSLIGSNSANSALTFVSKCCGLLLTREHEGTERDTEGVGCDMS